MSGDRPADSVETGLAEANAVPNGKGHEEEMSLSGNTPSADAGEK